MNLSNKFTEERRKINTEIKDERCIAHCHTTINKIEEGVKKTFKELKEKLEVMNVKEEELFKQILGENFI